MGGSSWWLWVGILLLILIIAGAIWYYTRVMEKSVASVRTRHRKGEPSSRRRPRPRSRQLTSEAEAAHWKQIKVGDLVTLTDQQTIELLMKDKKAGFAMGVELTVRSVGRLREQNRLAEWIVAEFEPVRIEGEDSVWYLVVKIVDDSFDLRVMFVPDGVPSGSRHDLLEAGHTWLFMPPEDEFNFEAGDLQFTEAIDQQIDGQDVVYHQKHQGVLFAEYDEDPRLPNVTYPQFATVLEYRTDAGIDNPEILVLELGGVKPSDRRFADSYDEAQQANWRAEQSSRHGGFITMYNGTNVGLNDVELMPR